MIKRHCGIDLLAIKNALVSYVPLCFVNYVIYLPGTAKAFNYFSP